MSANQIISEEGYDITEHMGFTSIYIPNVPEDLMLNGRNVCNESEWKYFFEIQFPLGLVKRVDIATRPHRSGGQVRCAFVHFEKWNSPFSDKLRWDLANNGDVRLYGPHAYASFYSSSNRSFERFITLKINKAPIAEVSELDAAQMNIHQLVDNYRRLETKLAEKDAKITELEETVKYLQNMCDSRLCLVQDLEFELMSSRCALGDLGDYGPSSSAELDQFREDMDIDEPTSPRDKPMTMDELEANSPKDRGPMTISELDLQSNNEFKLVRLTPGNVSQYIGHNIMFRSRNREVITKIISVSSGLKTIKIDHPDLQNNLEIVSRKIYVIV